MRKLMLIAFLLSGSALAAAPYKKVQVTDLERDTYACKVETAAYEQGLKCNATFGNGGKTRKFFTACMAARGWKK